MQKNRPRTAKANATAPSQPPAARVEPLLTDGGGLRGGLGGGLGGGLSGGRGARAVGCLSGGRGGGLGGSGEGGGGLAGGG